MDQAKQAVSIGETVKYFVNRPNVQTGENFFFGGEGVVTALFLNPDKRLMVQVKDGEKLVNVEAAMINASEETQNDYRAMVEAVDALSKEGNEALRKVADSYNAQVQEAFNSVLGVPVVIE